MYHRQRNVVYARWRTNAFEGLFLTPTYEVLSLDSNPLDDLLWGHGKLVYVTSVENAKDLRYRIIMGCNAIKGNPGIF